MATLEYAEGPSPRLSGRAPAALVEAARRALGRPDATNTELVRAGLAALAGLDPAQHAAPMRPGRRPRRRAA